MTADAPAASASATSRGCRTPPSAQTCAPSRRGRVGALEHGRELRAADAGHHPGGAHGARPDADLDDVRAGLDQLAGALGRDDVAGDDGHGRRERAHRGQRLDHPLLVAVRGVEDEHVDAGVEQLGGARLGVAVDAHRRGDAQPSARRRRRGGRSSSAAPRCGSGCRRGARRRRPPARACAATRRARRTPGPGRAAR